MLLLLTIHNVCLLRCLLVNGRFSLHGFFCVSTLAIYVCIVLGAAKTLRGRWCERALAVVKGVHAMCSKNRIYHHKIDHVHVNIDDAR